MTTTMIDEMFDVLEGLYSSSSESLLALWAVQDGLISRYEHRRGTGREAPAGVRGLVCDDESTLERPIRCGGCGNCDSCCGWGE